MVLLRAAVDDDAPAIAEIMNALLDTTTYEWTDTPHTADERAEWLARQRAAGHPVLVAVDDAGQVVGWGAYGDFRDSVKWPGYSVTVEHSIHVRESAWGQGVGRALIDALMNDARAAGKRVIVAAIDGSNERSISFHAQLGFIEVARMPGVGSKHGMRLDLVLMQRDLTG